MSSFEVDRLHASDATRHVHAARLAQSFDLYLRGVSPPLASALAGGPTASRPAAIIVSAILAVADRIGSGDAVAAFDGLRQSGRAAPRHDAIMGHALMAALKEVLGSAFDGTTRQAWADGYIRVVETVMAARRNRMDFVA